MPRKKYFTGFFYLALICFSFYSCSKEMDLFSDIIEPVSKEELAVEKFYKIMTENYFWYNYIPSEIDYDDYGKPEDLLEAIRYKSLDHWSFITTQAEFYQYYVEGVYTGFGLQFLYDSQNNFYVAFIFNDSPLYPLGVRRGWILKDINGIPVTADNFILLMGEEAVGVTRTLGFLDSEQVFRSFTVAKKQITINTVLAAQVKDGLPSQKIGYLVLESFIAPAKNELESAFAYFKSEGVNELILDLRYNGGGRTDVANFLASNIYSPTSGEAVFAKYIFNDKLSANNFSDFFVPAANTLPLTRMVVITTPMTASASEMVINGLKPYITVKQVGLPTHGKPVGMITFDYNEYVFVPIVFEVRNALNSGGYFNGIYPDEWCYDDVRYNWGSMDETCFRAAYNYLTTGNFKSFVPSSRVAVTYPAGNWNRLGNMLWLTDAKKNILK